MLQLKKVSSSASLATIAIAMATVGTTANAQDADQPPSARPVAASAGQGLGDIVVTARRINERLQDVPVAVSALTGATIEKLGIKQAEDLQNHTPNVYIRQDSLGGSVQPVIIVRGQAQTLTTDENTATYFADVPQTTRGIASGFYDLQSVQILKGPQGTLFGKNSNGGAVVITPNRPVDAFEGSVKAEIGRFDRRQLTAILNIPLADILSVRVAGEITRQDGSIKNTLPGFKDLDDEHTDAARVSVLFKPTETIENLLVFDYAKRDETLNPRRPIAAGTTALSPLVALAVAQSNALGLNSFPAVTGRDGLNSHGVPTSLIQWSKVYGFSNVTTFELSDSISLKNIFGFRNEKADSGTDTAGTAGFFVSLAPVGFPAGSTGQVALNYPRSGIDRDTVSNEFQIIGDSLDGRLKWIAGAFYSHFKSNETSWSAIAFGPIAISGQPNKRLYQQTQISKAIFAQATLDTSDFLLDGLSLTVGGRFTHDKRRQVLTDFARSLSGNGLASTFPLDAVFTPGGPYPCRMFVPGQPGVPLGSAADGTLVDLANCVGRDKTGFKAFTYNLTADWKVNENLLLYLAHRRGYKAGGMNFTVDDPQFNDYGKETLTDIELGLKASGNIGSGRYLFNVAAFRGVFKGIQQQSLPDLAADYGLPPQSVIILAITNNASAVLKGFELEAGLQFGDLEVSANYSYQHSRFTRGAIPTDGTTLRAGTGIDITGLAVPGSPKETAGVNATYSPSWFPKTIGSPSLTASYSWQGVTPGLVASGSAPLPSHHVIDARLDIADFLMGPIDLGFFVKNVTNESYMQTCTDNRATLGYLSCKFSRRRTFGMSGRFRF